MKRSSVRQFRSISNEVNQLCGDLTRKFLNVGIEETESRLSAEFIIAHVMGKKMVIQVEIYVYKQFIIERHFIGALYNNFDEIWFG